MPAAGWTRRGVLGLVVLGSGALAGRLLWKRTSFLDGPSPDERFLEPLSVQPLEGDRFRDALLGSSHTALMSPDFGRLYLDQRKGRGADVSTLAAEVMARLEAVRPWRQLQEPLDTSELEGRLHEAIAADFLAADGICDIDGWYLAHTECRLAAMKFLATS